MKCLLVTLATCIVAHPFGLEFDIFDGGEDASYGHHGKPANYKTLDGIVHPWSSEKKRNLIIMDPAESLLDLWFDDMGMMDDDMRTSMEMKMDSEDEDEEDMAMLTIMQSTPEMCPLCSKEGHSLGHEDHKKFLAKLREKMLSEKKDNKGKKNLKKNDFTGNMKTSLSCTMCQAEGSTHNHKEHEKKIEGMKSCPLCKAEGSIMNHAAHNIILDLAKEMELPEIKEMNKMEKKYSCKLCKHEGTDKNHDKHLEMAEALKMKTIADKKSALNVLRKQHDYTNGLKRMVRLMDDHRDLMVASIAEAQMNNDRKQRFFPEAKVIEFTFEFGQDDLKDLEWENDFDWGIMDKGEMPFEMAAATLARLNNDPPRDFHLRSGTPADMNDDDNEDEEESLWDKIIRNIHDLFGGLFTSSNNDHEDDNSEVGMVMLLLLIFFVGSVFIVFGVIELFAMIFGEEKIYKENYSSLPMDEDMMLAMETGSYNMIREDKGKINI